MGRLGRVTRKRAWLMRKAPGLRVRNVVRSTSRSSDGGRCRKDRSCRLSRHDDGFSGRFSSVPITTASPAVTGVYARSRWESGRALTIKSASRQADDDGDRRDRSRRVVRRNPVMVLPSGPGGTRATERSGAIRADPIGRAPPGTRPPRQDACVACDRRGKEAIDATCRRQLLSACRAGRTCDTEAGGEVAPGLRVRPRGFYIPDVASRRVTRVRRAPARVHRPVPDRT
jgi:hypothetical protein